MSTGSDATARAVVVRDDDPRLPGMLADGWTVVAESWGARLRVTPQALRHCFSVLAAVREQGWVVRELGPDDVTAIVDLDARSLLDYPDTPQNGHDVPDEDALRADLTAGTAWAWGAFGGDPGAGLAAVTVLRAAGALVDTDFTVVDAAARRRGLASAVKAAAVLGLAGRGHTMFGSGGAAANVASRRANEAVGYTVTEHWLSVAPGEVP